MPLRQTRRRSDDIVACGTQDLRHVGVSIMTWYITVKASRPSAGTD